MKKKILIIRFSSIGDIVLTSPVIRCIKEQMADAEVHFLTKKTFVEILEANPYLDKIYSINKSISEITDHLKAENYHFIVDLHHNIRSWQVKRQLKKPSASFKKLTVKKWLFVHFKINFLPKIHIVDRYLNTALKLGIKNDFKGLDYFIPLHDEVRFSDLPTSHQSGYIGFVIGAAHTTKQLPTDKIIAICKKINQPIILLGGKNDEQKGNLIHEALGNIVFNSCGKYNINQSASIIKNATKIITHDTGLMHIASALKKEIISVWGNTVPEFGMYPYFPTPNCKIIEVKNLPCRPCSKIGFNKCPKGHFKCMNEIEIDAF